MIRALVHTFSLSFLPPGWWRGVRHQRPHTVLPPLLCWCKKFSIPAVSCLPAKGLLRQGAALGCKLLNTLFGSAHQDRYPHPSLLFMFSTEIKREYTLWGRSSLGGQLKEIRSAPPTASVIPSWYQACPLYRNIVFLIGFSPLLAQVTYRGRPLSYYLLNAEAAGNAAQPRAEDAAPHGRTRYPQEEELTGLWKCCFVQHVGAAYMHTVLRLNKWH